MNRPVYYDRQGKPLSRAKYLALAAEKDYARLLESTIQTPIGPLWVSTVWLGIDHNHGGHGPPVIFETMIFKVRKDGSTGFFDDESLDESLPVPTMERYQTESEAFAGHRRILKSLAAL